MNIVLEPFFKRNILLSKSSIKFRKKLKLIKFSTLERKLFLNFFKPFFSKDFEKTDPLHRALFLDKYLTY